MSGSNGSRTEEPQEDEVQLAFEQLRSAGATLGNALAKVTERRAQEIADHQARMTAFEQDRARLRKAMRALGIPIPEEDRLASGRKPADTTQTRRYTKNVMSPAKLLSLAEMIAAYADQGHGKFSVLEVHYAHGGERPEGAAALYTAFNRLREREFLLRAGKEPGPKGRQLWRLGDREVIDQLKDEVKQRGNSNA